MTRSVSVLKTARKPDSIAEPALVARLAVVPGSGSGFSCLARISLDCPDSLVDQVENLLWQQLEVKRQIKSNCCLEDVICVAVATDQRRRQNLQLRGLAIAVCNLRRLNHKLRNPVPCSAQSGQTRLRLAPEVIATPGIGVWGIRLGPQITQGLASRNRPGAAGIPASFLVCAGRSQGPFLSSRYYTLFGSLRPTGVIRWWIATDFGDPQADKLACAGSRWVPGTRGSS